MTSVCLFVCHNPLGPITCVACVWGWWVFYCQWMTDVPLALGFGPVLQSIHSWLSGSTGCWVALTNSSIEQTPTLRVLRRSWKVTAGSVGSIGLHWSHHWRCFYYTQYIITSSITNDGLTRTMGDYPYSYNVYTWVYNPLRTSELSHDMDTAGFHPVSSTCVCQNRPRQQAYWTDASLLWDLVHEVVGQPRISSEWVETDHSHMCWRNLRLRNIRSSGRSNKEAEVTRFGTREGGMASLGLSRGEQGRLGVNH